MALASDGLANDVSASPWFPPAGLSFAAADEGPGRIALYDEDDRRRTAERRVLVQELRHAIDGDDGLSLVFQPIVRVDDGTPVAVEALIRWTHPERGPLSPLEFVPLAEETGLILAWRPTSSGSCCRRRATGSRGRCRPRGLRSGSGRPSRPTGGERY